MSRNFELPAGEDTVLRCSHFPAQGEPRSVVVIAHGYKGFKDWGMFPYTAQALSDEHEVISFNFSHAGIGEDLQISPSWTNSPATPTSVRSRIWRSCSLI